VIVTVTLNPAVDKTVRVHALKPGATNRATIERVEVGGKGINVARTLKRLGAAVTAIGFLGAEDSGGTVAMLARHGIAADFVAVAGETRVNLKVIDPVDGLETEINEPGFAVPAEAIAALADKLRVLSRAASVVVFSGSLPPGAPVDLYAQLIELARGEGARTALDTAAGALAAGLGAAPDLVKPNRAEVEELLGMTIDDDTRLAGAAQRLLAMGARTVVISLGRDGAFAASADGMWHAYSPMIAAGNTIGAGDAMMAALARGVTQALPLPDALRVATAAGCAAAAMVERYPSWRDIEMLMPQIRIEPRPAAGTLEEAR